MKAILKVVLTVITLVIGAFLAWIIVSWTGMTLYNRVSDHSQASSFDDALSKQFTDLSKTLPKTMDSKMRMDAASVRPNRTMYYHYTLTTQKVSDLDLPKFVKAVKAHVVNYYQTDVSFQPFRDNGVTLDYDYFDANGHHIAEIIVGPNDVK